MNCSTSCNILWNDDTAFWDLMLCNLVGAQIQHTTACLYLDNLSVNEYLCVQRN